MLPLRLKEGFIELVRASIPDLPDEIAQRLIKEYNIDTQSAKLLCLEDGGANYFEELAKTQPPLVAALWFDFITKYFYVVYFYLG